MNVARFDRLVRSLAATTTRRLLLGALAGAGLIPSLGRLAGDEVDARRKKNKKKCKNGKKRCGKRCVSLATNGANCGICGNACLSGECNLGFCQCNGGLDCPTGCKCALALNGDTVCAGEITSTPCDSTPCPPRSACLQTIGGAFCAEPCLG